MYSLYQSKAKDPKIPQQKSNIPKTQYFRSSLKSRQDLSFLKYRDQQNQKVESKVRDTLNRPDYKFVSHTTKHDEKMHNNFFKMDDELKSKFSTNQFSLNRSTEKRATTSNAHPVTPADRKQFLENIKPEASQYQKLHDKLNYLQNKITEMRTNLEKKRDEKKKYFEREVKERKQILESQWGRNGNQKKAADPLKQVVSQVSYQKKFQPMAFDPYSPRHNVYYVSEIVRAYKEENSLAREHLVSSIQLLKMLGRSRLPTREQLSSRTVKLAKKAFHQDKKTVVFDLDQTLIHCNENIGLPYDVKLPIKFPTGEVIEAGINIRPYAVQILKNLSKNFEVIVFTASHSCYANVVLNHLDPENKYIAHRLFRQHCYPTSEGVYVKDLRVINRDLSQMVLVDNAAYSYAFQVDNGIPIIPYYEGKIDFELKALQSYIENMMFSKDVREVNRSTFKLHRYNEFDSPESLVKELYHEQLR